MRKKEMLPQNDGERQKTHITTQGWVDIFMCKIKVGDGEKLNLGKDDYCRVILWVVKAGMTTSIATSLNRGIETVLKASPALEYILG